MDTGIGPTLRDARNRRKVELSEVEAATKIRARFLRAMENEDWDVLPGGAYSRGFVRTYATYLGLDGDRLAEDYRRATEPPGGERAPKRLEPVPTAARRRRSGPSGRVVLAVVSVGMVALLIGIGLAGGENGDDPGVTVGEPGDERQQVRTEPAVKPGVAVRLAATAEVWVCLLDADEEALVDGEILAVGAEAGPYRSEGFELASGNGSLTIFVDGRRAEVAPSSSPIGYRVDADGELVELEEGERPDCE
ncbi:MAG: helix-turn-helix domain-containing protein [Solirubrobacterales bacterium]